MTMIDSCRYDIRQLFRYAFVLTSLACIGIQAIQAADTVSAMYGINDPVGNGTQPGDIPAKIIQITMSQTGTSYSATFAEVFDTGMYGQANAFAYDTSRNEMFFISSAAPGGSFSGKSLYYWDRGASLSLIANSAQIGLTTANIPANAVYYANAFWFFDENGTDELVKVNMTYSGNTPSFSSTQRFSIGGYSGSTAYGDIAIDINTGILYGASTQGLFFSLNVSGATPTGYSQIKAANSGNPSLQIAFSPDYSILYGQNYADGKWYVFDKTNGNLTDIGVTSPTNMRQRDLGGSSFSQVPEPSTYALATIGSLVLAILARRNRVVRRPLA